MTEPMSTVAANFAQVDGAGICSVHDTLRHRLSPTAASAHFGITPGLLHWRLHALGVETKAKAVLRSAA